MKRIFSLIFFLIILVLGLFFGLLNAQPVTVNYYFGQHEISLSLILVVTLLTGAICGVLAALGLIFSMSRDIARLRREIKSAEKELANLRSIPFKDEH